MKTIQNFMRIIALLAAAFAFTACNQIKNIPAGFIAKKLDTTGWGEEIYPAGQIDIGQLDSEGRGSSLVLLEATSVTHKETFGKADGQGTEDHRIVTKKRILVSVDIYCRLILPADKKICDSVFAMSTPQDTNDARVKVIHLVDIYKQFATMGIRGKARALLAKYDDDMDILSHSEEVNKEISRIFAATFEENHIPLQFMDVQISNVKVDEAIWGAQQKATAASSEVQQINEIGAAIAQNPGYLEFMKWKTLKEIAEAGGGKGLNTIIVTDGSHQPLVLPVPSATFGPEAPKK